MRDDEPMTADGWDGVHLGEATAHAWLDGALPPAEAARAATHVAGCADCAALVAEARGLIAGASRILGALDAVPAGVVPAGVVPAGVVPAGVVPAGVVPAARPRAPRRWWTGAPARAAAAVLLLAGGSAVVLRQRGPDATALAGSRAEVRQASDAAAPGIESAPAMAPAVAAPADPPPPAAAPAPARARRAAPAPEAARAAEQPVAQPISPAPAADALAARSEERRDERRDERHEAAAKAVAAPPPPPVAQALVGRAAGSAAGSALASGTVVGKVVAPDGQPLANASVQVTGTSLGALSDTAGAFVLRGVRPGPATLRARRVGYDQRSATVAVSDADTATATIVLDRSELAPSQVVASAAPAGSPGVGGAVARVAVGCWAVRPARGWTAAAPALPDLLRLDQAAPDGADGTARPADADAARAGWRDGAWRAVGQDAITVALPAAGGAAELTLRRAAGTAGGWRGTATWTAATDGAAPRGRTAPVEVTLAAARCPAR